MRRTISRAVLFSAVLACVMSTGLSDIAAQQQRPDGNQWTTYSGDDSAQRHSPLTQITPANVGRLTVQWMFQTGVPGRLEATPLVVDGIMYLTGPDNHAWALDARTGRQIWHYRRQLPERLNICCGRVNRGFAISGDRLYMTTLDAHLRRARCKDRKRPVRRRDRRSHEKLYGNGRAAHRQGQGHRRNRGSRVRHPRIHRCLRCQHRQEGVAILDRS